MRFDRVWNVPTSEIQNLRNVKIKIGARGKRGKEWIERERKARKIGENGVRMSEAKQKGNR